MMVFAGIDIGYGDVKAVLSVGTKIKFPSAVAYEGGGILDVEDEQVYEYNGRKYYVGKRALISPNLYSTLSLSFLEQFTPLLAYKVFEEAGVAPCGMCVGLPVGHYREINRENLKNRLKSVRVNGRTVHVDIVDTAPQGVGVLLDYRLDSTGNFIEGRNENAVVLDVGFNTLDVVTAVEGQAVREYSGMIEQGGISKVCRKLASTVQERTTVGFSEQEMKDVLLSKEIRVYGKRVDLSTDISLAVEEYIDWLEKTIESGWGKNLHKVDRVIVAGGGAYYLAEHLKRKYGNVYVPEEPEFANARGFLKLLLLRNKLGIYQGEGENE